MVALIVHFIINCQALLGRRKYDGSGKSAGGSRRKDDAGYRSADEKTSRRYRLFLIASICYYITDIAWGILYEHHDIAALFPFLYSATIFYFIFMLLTMLTWIRYVVAYLDKHRMRSKALLYSVWVMFGLGIIYLMINRFFPFIFYFNDAHEYIGGSGRYVAYILQITLYLINTVYMLFIASKSSGQEKTRYKAVGLTSLVLMVFQIFQIIEAIFPFYAMGLLIGTCVIHSFVEEGERKEKETYDNIAKSLAEDYEAIYYIDIASGEYHEFSTSTEYDSMNVPMAGKDFYTETRENALRYAHPDDREFAKSLYYKETMLKNLEGRNSYSYKYRIMVCGEARYFSFTVMKAEDKRHLVLYEKDINDEITAETMNLENQKKSITYSRIAESLASNYDAIYYVNIEDSSFVSYQTNNIFGQLEVRRSGDDFFADCAINIPKIIHKSDRDRVIEFISADNLMSALENKKEISLDYRIIVDGKSRYARMTARKTSDGTHFIIGIEDVDDDVKKEKQVLKALNTEKELARRDELTGIKNKTAYLELEKSVQSNIDNGMDYLPFAMVVCDANDLKMVNDTEGHAAGDEYIKASAKLLCDIFVHSPVFRVGGDEFVVFIRGDDYINRGNLMEKLQNISLENRKKNVRPVLASGMAEYIPETDSLVSEIFDRADKEMYENKQSMKKI